MTTTAAVDRPTVRDLTADQRSILVAVAAAEYGRATFKDLATALGWTEQHAEHVANSLPLGITTRYTQSVHLRGVGLWPEGQTLAEQAREYETGQLRLLEEGEVE